MQDWRRYRDKAAECLLAAQDASQPCYRKIHLSMAVSWLSLAHRDEERGILRAIRRPVETDELAA
jgi:hypothetical protein